MSEWRPYEAIAPRRDGVAQMLIVADHASNAVPPGLDLGLPVEEMTRHIAWDIGVAGVSRRICADTGCGAVLCGFSRLVIDCNREEDVPGLVPLESDGTVIPGNEGVHIADRLERYYRPYHAAVAGAIDSLSKPFLLSLHSFTPELRSKPEEVRPWEIGILYNEDDRAARIAIPRLGAAGLKVGDQLPYSGRLLNATMNRHGEARGIPYLGVEMRQDLVSDEAGEARMAGLLAPICADIARLLTK